MGRFHVLLIYTTIVKHCPKCPVSVKYGMFIIIIIINTYLFVRYILVLPINTSYFLDVGPSCLHIFAPAVPLPEDLCAVSATYQSFRSTLFW